MTINALTSQLGIYHGIKRSKWVLMAILVVKEFWHFQCSKTKSIQHLWKTQIRVRESIGHTVGFQSQLSVSARGQRPSRVLLVRTKSQR